jgi:hypothetical protein
MEIQIDEIGGIRSFIQGVTLPIRSTSQRFVNDVDLVKLSDVINGVVVEVLVRRDPIGVTSGSRHETDRSWWR